MILKLATGREINIENYQINKEYVGTELRDIFEIRINAASISLNEVDEMFNTSSCMKMIVREQDMMNMMFNEDGSEREPIYYERIFERYCVRVMLSKQAVNLWDPQSNRNRCTDCIVVKMSLKTEVEELQETVDELLLELLGV